MATVVTRPNNYNFAGAYFSNPVVYDITSVNTSEAVVLSTRKFGGVLSAIATQNQTIQSGAASFDLSSILRNEVENTVPSATITTPFFEADQNATIEFR